MKSKSAFLCHRILYVFVYDIDYSKLHEYNTTLGRISNNLNQIAKHMNATGNIYFADVKEVKELIKKSVGYAEVHALKTALHEAVN